MQRKSVPRVWRRLSLVYLVLFVAIVELTKLGGSPSFDDGDASALALPPAPPTRILNSSLDLGELEEEQQLWDGAAQQRRILSSVLGGLTPGTAAFNHLLRERLKEIPQCAALGTPFLDYLHKYLLVHYYSPDAGNATTSPAARLIYSCESHKKGHGCNGFGDRFRGMISVFWLALLLRRRFEVYHPTPVSMQKYMPPYLVNYIPTWSNASGGASMHSAKSYRESISPLIGSAPTKFVMHVTKLKKHFEFQKTANVYVGKLPKRGSEEWWRPQYAVRDIRVQTNTMSFDNFLHVLPELVEIKNHVLGLKGCGAECYTGCLSHALFQPDERLWSAAVDVIRSSNEPELIRRVDGLQRPPAGLVIPLVGLQLRMGGSLAKDLLVPERVRTFPWMLPHYYSLVTEVVTGAAWRNRPDLFPENYALRDWFPVTGGVARPVSLFVTSDSRQVVAEVLQMADGNRSDTLRVLHDTRDMYLHTDTLTRENFQAITAKYGIEPSQVPDRAYLNTLVAHYLLSISAHLITAQSVFGETARWRSRQVLSAIRVDVDTQQGRQLHQWYRNTDNRRKRANETKSFTATHTSLRRVLVNMHLPPTPFYAGKK